ncbi:hypothetical protein F383_05337 [Gossypium arboreum]|uniref:Uncharacterized protein n=1 Tax=Gossypium arboreum TaxID=29729 RepID=A0A0B0PPI0_GOSAR|nr:hypothetical protein F383_05337 [Gossypium arboreum]
MFGCSIFRCTIFVHLRKKGKRILFLRLLSFFSFPFFFSYLLHVQAHETTKTPSHLKLFFSFSRNIDTCVSVLGT